MKQKLFLNLLFFLGHFNLILIFLKNKKIFLTGGTGFFGKWLLESFIHFNDNLNLKARLFILSRNPEKFLSNNPQSKKRDDVVFIKGDVRTFEFLEEKFHYIIHAALPASYTQIKPIELLDIGINGTKRVLEFAKYCKAEKFLFVSSGVVYGKQPPEIKKLSENSFGSLEINPENPKIYYAEAKRVGELLCYGAMKEWGLNIVIARCFSFIGPFMPLDAHFAIGNFIRDALKGGPIVIESDGTKITSYMYAEDLAYWLWTILLKGKPGEAYNVGSEKEISLKELAKKIAEIYTELTGKKVDIIIKKQPEPGKIPERYVPSTEKAKKELGLKETVSLEEAIRKTLQFYHTFQGAFPEDHREFK